MYQGNIALNAVFQGATRIWPGSLINRTPRPDENLGLNAIRLNPNGTTSYRSAYASEGVGYSGDLGDWRRTTLPLATGDTFQVKVDRFLNIGDYVAAQSDLLGTWFNLNPADGYREWVAENDQGFNRAIFRVSIKDANGNREVWYADCYTNTSGRVSKTPIPWSGSFAYPAYGGTVNTADNLYFGPAEAAVSITKDGTVTAPSVLGNTKWVTQSTYSTVDIGGSYWIKVTQTAASGDASTYNGPAQGDWTILETTQNIGIVMNANGSSSKTFRLQIASDQWGENVVSDQTVVVNLTASYEEPVNGGPGDQGQ